MELGDEIYEEQVIRGSIQEKIFPIGQVKSDFEEAQVVYDAFQCHEWVHDIGRILHRDISMNNLMFRRIDGEVYGVLNDFDLATGIDDLDRTPTSKHRAGTRPFMAHEQHSDKWNGPPRYRHDAESFFYLILMLGCNYSKPGTKVENAPYGSWFDAGDQHLYLSKRVLYTEGVFLPPTKRSGYEEWGRQIQRLLIRGFNARLSFELDRDNEPDGGSFNQDTLGGHFTADKLREVLSRFDNRIVISRDPAKLYLNFPS
ncbi:hypothetical protein GYMLUDRAFT_170014 [Collybiopsis luxurians FD-317 M1]|uniref:Protein kinase domain-containing protein n=1 Tax=Collybiopsis luxurians FD-317 M1 TaxID=944289 RepID=A0A0D0CTJ4_9AGAR|nr:hypothetical protein GYMLUDRAFT_170014 [Collybiopsis luxurians FD-317 M1]